MQATIASARNLKATISVPGDKSISHRALMLGAIARGQTVVTNLSPSADCVSTRRCLEQMGVEFAATPSGDLVINGRGLRGLIEPNNVLDAGNSGTTTRLLSGILAGLPFCSVLTGDDSLRSRPMDRILKPLTQMGAMAIGRDGDRLLPIAIRGGNLRGINYTPRVPSAQVKSAILLAGLYAEGETVVEELEPTRDHTERMLTAMDVAVNVKLSKQHNGSRIALKGFQEPSGTKILVPGDASSAAFFLVAATITPDSDVTVTNVGMNLARTGFVEILRSMGAAIKVTNQREVNGEPVADITCQTSTLRGMRIEGSIIPAIIDELPILAVAATQAEGTTVVRDAQELRVKESDRIATTVDGLSRLGANIEAAPDGFVIEGPTSLRGARCQSHGDHRIAMSMAIAALTAKGETTIDDADCVDISFPGFFELLNRIAR
jgi:3-phosphoshikimate 1-carboxyvinyltransferase